MLGLKTCGFLSHVLSYFWNRVVTEPGVHWLARVGGLGIFLSASLARRWQLCRILWVLGFKLRSSCLLCKCFTNCACPCPIFSYFAPTLRELDVVVHAFNIYLNWKEVACCVACFPSTANHSHQDPQPRAWAWLRWCHTYLVWMVRRQLRVMHSRNGCRSAWGTGR